MSKLVATVMVLTVSAHVAAAEPPGETPISGDAAPAPSPSADAKDPGTAVTLSVAGTLASAVATAAGLKMAIDEQGGNGAGPALFVGGLATSLITPSLGEFYAGRYLTVGMGIRVASAAMVIGAMVAAESSTCSETCNSNMAVIGVTGAIGYAVGIGWDIATAGKAANDFNKRHALALSVAPTVISQPSGPVMGLGVGGRF